MAISVEMTTGEVGVAIGTSLAIEGLCGVHPDNKIEPAPVKEIGVLWLNLETMVRNLYNSVDPIHIRMVTLSWLVDNLVLEIETIDKYVSGFNEDIKIIPYWVNDETMRKRYNWMEFKVSASPKVKFVLDKYRKAAMSAQHAIGTSVSLSEFNVTLNGKTAILTHFVMDLATQKNTTDLLLLESHTGKLKPPSKWHEKMMIKSDVELPFKKAILAICGDRHQVAPMSKLKRRLLKLTKEHKWNRNTTIATMISKCAGDDLADLKEFLTKHKSK